MDAYKLLELLSSDMDLEPDGDPPASGNSSLPHKPVRRPEAVCISEAQMSNGGKIRLLKTLLTSACERNCYYCPFRAGRDFRRATLKPDEMAGTFMTLYRAGIAEGIFLSSGIAGGGVRTQDAILDTADVLRNKLGYTGYLHLKLMPGAEYDQVLRTMQLASRVSVNLEAPNDKRLERLAPRKNFFEELLQPLRWVEQIRRTKSPGKNWNRRWPSSTTQFVVGPAGENDLELLSITGTLYRQMSLRRAYYSSFRPIRDTPFENLPAESDQRERRLYQASFLLRDYGFDLEDLHFDANGNLPQDTDPKLTWAQNHLKEAPLEINRANRQELLRIPGIGPKSASAILKARQKGRLRSVEDLQKIGLQPARSLPFILLDGSRPDRQLSFWLP